MPVWYRSVPGRVAWSATASTATSSTWRQRAGARFFSTRAVDHDEGARATGGGLPGSPTMSLPAASQAPYAQRDPDDWEDRAGRLWLCHRPRVHRSKSRRGPGLRCCAP
jgi:hypothetical protein